MNLDFYKPGAKVCSPSEEELTFDISDNEAILWVKLNNPTEEDRASFNEHAQFKMASSCDILYFLCRFGDMQWMYAPFHFQMSCNHITRPYLKEPFTLTVNFVNAQDGSLIRQRKIELSVEFVSAIFYAIEKQPFNDDYDNIIDAVNKKIPVNSLVDNAFTTN